MNYERTTIDREALMFGRNMLRTRFVTLILLGLTVLMPVATQAQGTPAQQEVAFSSGDLQLRGFLWKPEGGGPFPALLWNHGSEKLPGWLPTLGP